MSLRILSTVLTSPELLRSQIRALRKYIVGDYQITLVNDAYDQTHFSNMWQEGMARKLRMVAQEFGAQHWRFPQENHNKRWRIFPDEPEEFWNHNNANSRCADAIQFGINRLLKQSDDPLLILDADMIPVRRFDPTYWLSQCPIWGIPENRGEGIDYLWNGIILVNPRRARRMDLFNIDCGRVNGVSVDVGGMLGPFLDANEGQVGYWYRTPWEGFELCGGSFAHLRGGGNWQLFSPEEAKARIESFIQACR